MTPEQKLTPEQHAELNDFCGVHVMKWRKMRVYDWADQFTHDPAFYRKYCNTEIWVNDQNQNCHGDFNPTTSPADAMAVLEKCAEKCDNFDYPCVIEINYESEFEEAPWTVSHDRTLHAGEGKTLPLAIVLFAKALFEKEAAK